MGRQGRWQDTAETNQRIVGLIPDDRNTHNRLGKALMERGRYSKARDAFKRGLEIAPSNTIDKKNL